MSAAIIRFKKGLNTSDELNADLLDGHDSTYFAYAGSTYTKAEIDIIFSNAQIAPLIPVSNYSALPSAEDNSGRIAWASAPQGTKWLPGSIGGTFYPAGPYYSNGSTWEYTESPFQATQEDVDGGLINDRFLTPYTFSLASKWSTKSDASHTHTGVYAPALGTDDNYVTDAEKIVIGNTSGTNSGDNATNTTSNSYADGKVADSITNGVTTIAPSQNAVFDALVGKAATIHNHSGQSINPDNVILNKSYTDAEATALVVGTIFYNSDQQD